jgi:hypothetical protein
VTDTLRIGATDVSTLAVIESLDGVMSGGPIDAEPVVLPLVQGGYFAAGELHPYSWDLPLGIHRETRGEVYQALDALAALVDSRRAPLAMTRVVTYPGGEAEHTSTAMLASAWQPTFLGTKAARIVLVFTNLDGCWLSGTVTTTGITSSGTVTLPGTQPSSRATLTLSGDPGPQTVAVPATGTSVTFSGASDVDPVTVDVATLTATRDGTDVSGLLSHAGSQQGLILTPGANTVTLTGGGSVDVAARGVFR